MANYTNMVSTNQKRARKLKTLAINAINEMVTDGEKVTVAELVKHLLVVAGLTFIQTKSCKSP